jgi:myo-inositol 2-dehydrogenase/D-chiro-inositol 1-dehydrogenase
MKLAILGVDACTLALAKAAAENAELELAWVCELDMPGREAQAAELRSVAHGARLAPSWELFLDRTLVDAVLVASSDQEDLRSEQLRKLVQVGMPLVVAQPAVKSMLLYYELDMIRRDTACVLVPYLPSRLHPAVQALASVIADGSVGPIEQITFERPMAERTKPGVLAAFARDVDLVRCLCGEVNRIGAMGAASEDAAYAHLGVQMSGATAALARWTVVPGQGEADGRLLAIGTSGKIELQMRERGGVWIWRQSLGDQVIEREFPFWSPAAAALSELAEALRGQTTKLDWVDACRCVELTEAVPRSLHKGRTVELHYEDYTEEGTFKGTMTSLGCGVLLLGLVLLPIVALADNIQLHARFWPALLLLLLAVFLGLQLLKLVFPKKS